MPTLSPSIKRYYKVDASSKKHWILTCKVCGARWQLGKTDPVHVGNILKLLDHGMSHHVEKDEDE